MVLVVRVLPVLLVGLTAMEMVVIGTKSAGALLAAFSKAKERQLTKLAARAEVAPAADLRKYS